MANPTTSPQIPQHVAALLSHLTSRPGVKSTFILSRKDGSIIQGTGLLASSSSSPSSSSSSSNHMRNDASFPAPAGSVSEEPSTTTSPSTSDLPSASTPKGSTTAAQKTYKPSQAEALATHIFAFVTSASNLSLSLSHSPGEEKSAVPPLAGSSITIAAQEGGSGDRGVDAEGEGSETEDDEVKLLRLRTKKHEIVVVPDRKYLLCVVHDVAHSVTNPAAGSGGRLSSR